MSNTAVYYNTLYYFTQCYIFLYIYIYTHTRSYIYIYIYILLQYTIVCNVLQPYPILHFTRRAWAEAWLVFVHIHQLFRVQYTCFELYNVSTAWWICTNFPLHSIICHSIMFYSIPFDVPLLYSIRCDLNILSRNRGAAGGLQGCRGRRRQGCNIIYIYIYIYMCICMYIYIYICIHIYICRELSSIV